MDLNFVRRHWWSVYIVLYAIAFWPLPQPNESGGGQIRVLITFFAVLGGFFLTWTAYPDLRLSNIKNAVPFFKKHLAPLFALLFGFWAVISSFFSNTPIIGLLGSLDSNIDSAIGSLMLSFVFFLVYFEILRDEKIKNALISTIKYLLILLLVLSVIEVILKKSFLVPSALPSDLPVLNFGSNGHLGGLLILLSGGLFSFLGSSFWGTLFLLTFASFGIGLASSKSPYISLAAILVFLGVNKKFKIALASLGAILLGAVLASGLVFLINQTTSKRDFTAPAQYQLRPILYKTALKGILVKPIFGYGGPQFNEAWSRIMTQAEITRFFHDSTGQIYVKTFRDEKSGIEMFQVKDHNNKLAFTSAPNWKAHNQFLDIALMWGLVGLIFYVCLIFLSFKNLFKFNFFSFAIFAYMIWNLFWYMEIEAEGIFFVILAASCVLDKNVSRDKDIIKA